VARGLNADDRYTSIARLKAVGYWGVPRPLSARYVDMKTGKTAKANDTAKPALVISKWAIVVPMVESDKVLIEFSEDPAVR
jgi:hypothetical protein